VTAFKGIEGQSLSQNARPAASSQWGKGFPKVFLGVSPTSWASLANFGYYASHLWGFAKVISFRIF
jgi:hypothetical protein